LITRERRRIAAAAFFIVGSPAADGGRRLSNRNLSVAGDVIDVKEGGAKQMQPARTRLQ
jgi:hypothetical protein